MVMLYWTIGKYLVCNVLDNNKAEYGQKVVEELAHKLTLNYGKGFEKTSLFRMIKFYREFPDNQIVATLSQQLTWSAKEESLCCLNALPYPKSQKKQ